MSEQNFEDWMDRQDGLKEFERIGLIYSYSWAGNENTVF